MNSVVHLSANKKRGGLTRTSRQGLLPRRAGVARWAAGGRETPGKQHPQFPSSLQLYPRWIGPTIAIALVLLALASLVGVAFTSWHYWNVEQRAVQEKHVQWELQVEQHWKLEASRAELRLRKLREIEEALVRIRMASSR